MAKKIKYFNLFIIVILPIILGYFLFNPFEEIPLENIKEANSTYILVSNEYILNNKIGFLDSVRKIFGVPFDLDMYYLYFENLGDEGSFEIEINERKINVSDGKIPYGPVELNKKYLYSMQQTYVLTFNKEDEIHSPEEVEQKSKSLNRSFKVFARPLMSDIIVKIILFVISWMSVCWLFTRIHTLVFIDDSIKRNQSQVKKKKK